MRKLDQSQFGLSNSVVKPEANKKPNKKTVFEVSGVCCGNGFAMPPVEIIREK